MVYWRHIQLSHYVLISLYVLRIQTFFFGNFLVTLNSSSSSYLSTSPLHWTTQVPIIKYHVSPKGRYLKYHLQYFELPHYSSLTIVNRYWQMFLPRINKINRLRSIQATPVISPTLKISSSGFLLIVVNFFNTLSYESTTSTSILWTFATPFPIT